jgi:phage-related protein
MKKFEFVSVAAKRAYRELPEGIQHQFGTDLNAVQQGKAPFSAHNVLSESVGPGAFEKTTNGVDQKEMATAAKRYKEMKEKVDAERKRAKTSTPNRKK